jgi:predicted DNA-binding transcriptional regulator AlpA
MTPTAEPKTLKFTTQLPDSSSNTTTATTEDAGSAHKPPRKSAAAAECEPPILVTAAQSASLCGVSVTSWWRLVSRGTAPAPVHPTPASTRWKRASVLQYIDSLQPKRRAPRISKRQREGTT